jgi:hypothetical protein
MSKTERSQQLLNWLNKEKVKDEIQTKRAKEKVINEIKGLKKEQLFPKKEKLSVWKKIMVVLFGN